VLNQSEDEKQCYRRKKLAKRKKRPKQPFNIKENNKTADIPLIGLPKKPYGTDCIIYYLSKEQTT